MNGSVLVATACHLVDGLFFFCAKMLLVTANSGLKFVRVVRASGKLLAVSEDNS